MLRAGSRVRLLTLWGFAVLALLAVGVAAANRFAGPLPPRRLVMSAGREDGAYYQFALEYRHALARHGFTLDVLPGPGSLETLARLTDGRADVGFVQGGTSSVANTGGLVALGSVFYEPVWVFHRRELRVTGLADLKGRRVGVGEAASGTQALARRLLADNGVTADNSALRELPTQQFEAALRDGTLDAAFVVASSRAPIVSRLLAQPALTLMSERRDAAYRSRHPYLLSVRVSEGMIDMVRNLPPDDKTLLATAASLVVRDTVHPDWIRLLLMAATSVHRSASVPNLAGRFPSDAYVELPLSEQARRYLQTGPTWLERRFPFWLAGILDRLILTLLPIVTVLFPLFGFVLPMMDRRQRARIGRWYATLRETEQGCATGAPEAVEREIERLRALRAEVARVHTTPTLHLGELYHLRTHIDLALARLEQQRATCDRSYDIGRISA